MQQKTIISSLASVHTSMSSKWQIWFCSFCCWNIIRILNWNEKNKNERKQCRQVNHIIKGMAKMLNRVTRIKKKKKKKNDAIIKNATQLLLFFVHKIRNRANLKRKPVFIFGPWIYYVLHHHKHHEWQLHTHCAFVIDLKSKLCAKQLQIIIQCQFTNGSNA